MFVLYDVVLSVNCCVNINWFILPNRTKKGQIGLLVGGKVDLHVTASIPSLYYVGSIKFKLWLKHQMLIDAGTHYGSKFKPIRENKVPKPVILSPTQRHVSITASSARRVVQRLGL